jgi:hypothetical protein
MEELVVVANVELGKRLWHLGARHWEMERKKRWQLSVPEQIIMVIKINYG